MVGAHNDIFIDITIYLSSVTSLSWFMENLGNTRRMVGIHKDRRMSITWHTQTLCIYNLCNLNRFWKIINSGVLILSRVIALNRLPAFLIMFYFLHDTA